MNEERIINNKKGDGIVLHECLGVLVFGTKLKSACMGVDEQPDDTTQGCSSDLDMAGSPKKLPGLLFPPSNSAIAFAGGEKAAGTRNTPTRPRTVLSTCIFFDSYLTH